MMQHQNSEKSGFNADPESNAKGDGALRMLSSVRKFARSRFREARGSHDWDHTLRVYNLCEYIGRVENVDLVVVRIAAYLHDIARGLQDGANGGICHAQEGARLARPFLEQLPLKSDQLDNIVHCIESHRYRGHVSPRTPEAKVLFDADKLDAIGAVGVARAYLFAGEVGARLHAPEVDVGDTRPYTANDTGYREYIVKLRMIKERVLTAEGRRLAQRRHQFMETFFNRFLDEYEGKR